MNIIKLTKFQLRNKRFTLIAWSIGLFLMMFMYMILFPTMKELGQAKLDAMPEELLSLFGVTSFNSMGNWIQYFIMMYSIFVLVVSFFAATFTSSNVYEEEKTKSIEFLYGLQVSRSEIYFSKLLASFLGILLLNISMIVSAFICASINGGSSFILGDFLMIIKGSSFTIYFFMALAMMIAGLTAKFSPGMVSAAIVFILYMLGYLGTMLEDKGEILNRLSPFATFNGNNILEMSNTTIISLVIYLLITVTFIIIGWLSYRKRDFNI